MLSFVVCVEPLIEHEVLPHVPYTVIPCFVGVGEETKAESDLVTCPKAGHSVD